ncbi:MAG: 5-nucleotidase [Patescibacteria group bacterium]|nr:5-nucleotidase [Patescibacteria group bacterium]
MKNKTTFLLDFDGTLTSKHIRGKFVPSVISILREENHLDQDYVDRATLLSEKYHPIETDPSLSKEIKTEAMQEWWEKHLDLLIEKKLNKSHLKSAISSDLIQLRKGVKEFFREASNNKNKIVILSASGLGGETIELLLEKENIRTDNIHIISNILVWNENDIMISYEKPLIHTFNKYNFFSEEEVDGKVVIVGDNLADAEMLPRNVNNNIKRIGIYDNKDNAHLEEYKKIFDEVWAGDDIDFNKLIKLL